MITQNQDKTRNMMLIVGLALLVVVGGVSGYLLTRPKPSPQTIIVKSGPGGMNSEQIAAANTGAVVYVEMAWSLIDVGNGSTLSQVYFKNERKNENDESVPIVANLAKTASLPVFFQLKGAVEPVLSTEDGGGLYGILAKANEAPASWSAMMALF